MNQPSAPPQQDVVAEDNAWHRQPTVWLVLGILGCTIAASFALLYIATTNPPELIDKRPLRIEAPERR